MYLFEEAIKQIMNQKEWKEMCATGDRTASDYGMPERAVEAEDDYVNQEVENMLERDENIPF